MPHDDQHTTASANQHLKDRHTPASLADPAFKMIEALGKVERASASMVSAMNKVADASYAGGRGGGGGGLSFMSVLLWGPQPRRESGNFWREFFITGRRVGKNFWTADGHFRGQARPSAWEKAVDRAGDRAKTTMAAGAALADSTLRAGSPASLRTLEKSWELFQAKAASGLVRPTAKLAFALQDGARWVSRQPDWAKEAMGWTAGLTIAGSAAVVALGTLARSVKATAEAAAWAAKLFRGTPAAGPALGPAAQAATSAGGSAVGTAAASTAGGAVGGAAGGGRFAGAKAMAGRVAGWAWPVAAALDTYDTYENPERFVDKTLTRSFPNSSAALNPGGAFVSPHRVAAWGARLFGASAEEADYFKAALDHAASRLNPIGDTLPMPPGPGAEERFKGTAADPNQQKAGYSVEIESNVRPAFLAIEDVYRDIAIRTMSTTPLDAEINKARAENYGKLVEEMQKANGHLGKIADKPAPLYARP